MSHTQGNIMNNNSNSILTIANILHNKHWMLNRIPRMERMPRTNNNNNSINDNNDDNDDDNDNRGGVRLYQVNIS